MLQAARTNCGHTRRTYVLLCDPLWNDVLKHGGDLCAGKRGHAPWALPGPRYSMHCSLVLLTYVVHEQPGLHANANPTRSTLKPFGAPSCTVTQLYMRSSAVGD